MVELLNNPKYKKVYISGPITGMENDNRQAFDNYEEKFKTLGFDVVNPLNLSSKYEIEAIKMQFAKKEITQKQMWNIFMKRDLIELMKCDFVAVLPGWALSKGANLEVYNARALDMPIVDCETLNELF